MERMIFLWSLEGTAPALFLRWTSNTGKRSIVLDLKTEDGMAAMHRLLSTAMFLSQTLSHKGSEKN